MEDCDNSLYCIKDGTLYEAVKHSVRRKWYIPFNMLSIHFISVGIAIAMLM